MDMNHGFFIHLEDGEPSGSHFFKMGVYEELVCNNSFLEKATPKLGTVFHENPRATHLEHLVYFALSVTCCLLWYFQWNTEERRMRSKWFREFPGPRPLPIVGNGFQMIFKPTEFYDWSWGLCKKWGDTVLLWRIQLPMMFVCKYETANELLSNNQFIAKSQDIHRYLWNLPGGNGLSSSPASVHNPRRKLLQPGYTNKVVQRTMHIFCEETRKMIEKLRSHADTGRSFEITQYLIPCSFRIYCRAALGDDIMADRTDEQAMEHMKALHQVEQSVSNRITSPNLLLGFNWIYYNLTNEGIKTKRYINLLNQFGREAIQKKLQMRKENINGSSYLDMLLDFHENGSLEIGDVLGELNNYIAAGYDTSALAIAWTVFAIALNPFHQDKIYEEIKPIFDSNENKILSTSDTKEMKYLELVIKEAFRLYPVSSALPRSTTQDTKLKDGRVIPAGTDVHIMVDMIHRDPRYFPEPEKFIPERHLKTNPAFLPFSTGLRSCIGQVLAMHHLKTELAFLIKEFVWETEETFETIPRLFQGLMVPANGIHVKIWKRKC